MRVNGEMQCFPGDNCISQDIFTARARMEGATMPSPRPAPGIPWTRVLSGLTGSPLSTAKIVLALRPAALPNGAGSGRIPTPAPGTSRPLTLRAGWSREGRRHGGAASLGRTGSPQPGLGSEGRRPGCDQALLQILEQENESTRLLKRESQPPRLLLLHQSPGTSALRQWDAAVPQAHHLPWEPAVLPNRWVLHSLRRGSRGK